MSLDDAMKSRDPAEQLRKLSELAAADTRAADKTQKKLDQKNIVYYVQSGMGALPVREVE